MKDAADCRGSGAYSDQTKVRNKTISKLLFDVTLVWNSLPKRSFAGLRQSVQGWLALNEAHPWRTDIVRVLMPDCAMRSQIGEIVYYLKEVVFIVNPQTENFENGANAPENFEFDNSFARELEACHVPWDAEKVSEPRLPRSINSAAELVECCATLSELLRYCQNHSKHAWPVHVHAGQFGTAEG